MGAIILFDGICNFCNQSVQFIIKKDHHGYFQFASLQSDFGKCRLKEYGLSENTDSLVLIDRNCCYLKSSAVLRICGKLNGGWKLLIILLIIPRPIRDFFYVSFARNRYKWFGKKESCKLLPPEIRRRFLDETKMEG